MTWWQPEELFAIWAPARSPWSAWAKPIQFAQLRPTRHEPESPEPEPTALASAPEFHRSRALVVELPGQQAAEAAVALARSGWQPVPLWNATQGAREVVDTLPLKQSLGPVARRLATIAPTAEAPPAFLLDAKRYRALQPDPGSYDNRSICLPQDFPSATRLRAGGIEEAVVVTAGDGPIAEDLAHVLLAWQQGGVRLLLWPQDGSAPHPLTVTPPSRFRRFWYRVVALSGLRRADVGGFGAQVPIPSARHGGFHG